MRGGTEDICEFLLMFLSTLLQSSSLQDFLKRLFIYYQSYQQHVHYASVALCAFGTSVILSASPPCSPPLCVPFIYSRLTLSLHISEGPEKSLHNFKENIYN